MKINFLLLAAIIAVAVKAQDEIESDDFPAACAAQCTPLVATTNRCDDTTNDDGAYVACVCSSMDASTLLPACASCIRSNGEDDDDNEAFELAQRCGFAVSSNSTSSMSGMSSTSSMSSTSTMSMSATSTSALSSALSSVSVAASTAVAPAPTSGGSANSGHRLAASMAAVPLVLVPIVAMV
ncbi:hypothetical protein PSEUBRA_002175 [Kalmanozyma brasiliensis GHG001]|uniref:uncharacterized protein n=1 Tax=Kalmanozyma brasiliensis (strain GHG001) TaxID=1365824 RepID=UPI001CEBE9A9|nr:uncharacterized protein PSEUBRA_002175 [Kalmanozyma brasiliensis GHG001]KAF6767051.1 hypothetical protein PSEUBRA_002175 [Kalmanozyma brasiliensis GHG001]